MTTASAFIEMLRELLLMEGFGEAEFEAAGSQDTGPNARHEGLVVQFRNGDEFQLTIIQSASGHEPEPAGEARYDVAPPRVVMTGVRS